MMSIIFTLLVLAGVFLLVLFLYSLLKIAQESEEQAEYQEGQRPKE